MALLDTIKTSAKVVGVFLDKHSPEILVGVGLLGMGGCVYLACKAAVQTEEDSYFEVTYADGTTEIVERPKKDIRRIAIKNFAPSAVVFAGSTACILGGYGILRRRYATALAVASATKQALDTYRKRIKEKYGEEADNYGMYGVEREEITVKNGETGKKEKIERDIIRDMNGDLSSPFAVLFAPFDYEHRTGSKYWERDTVANETQLTVMEHGWVTRYENGEPIFLDEIYKGLGFDVEEMYRMKGDAIRKMGWWKGHEPANADGYFTLRLTRVVNKPDPGYGEEVENVVWIVDPNVPGVIV